MLCNTPHPCYSIRAGAARERRTCPNRPKPMKEDSMAAKPLPDQALLLKLLRYEPDTGKLFWRERPSAMFATSPSPVKAAASFNRVIAGSEAFRSRDSDGYHQGWVLGQKVRAHRVIWKMTQGLEADQIDHIDGNPANNRIQNLRSVDHAGNCQNHPIRNDNKTGAVGVCKKRNSYVAEIRFNREYRYIGSFSSLEEAVLARKAAEHEVGFHANHGRQSK